MAGIRRSHGRPPEQKEAVLADDLRAMLATLDHRTCAACAIAPSCWSASPAGCAARRSSASTAGREDPGRRRLDRILRRRPARHGARQDRLARGRDRPRLERSTCPVAALRDLAGIRRHRHGPLFRRVARSGKASAPTADRQTCRPPGQATALAAGVRADLTEAEREGKFSGHSLRAGLASSAEVDERYVQKQLGHASAEMTRRYQRRRDRFRVNLTKAAGL